jgi:NADPH:quinone reductase
MQIGWLGGPEAMTLVDLPEPVPSAGELLIDIRAAAVSFPDLLQARGQYQYQNELPYIPGSEVAGTVRVAPAGCGFSVGQRVAAFTPSGGGLAEVVAVPSNYVFGLPDRLTFAEGAALPVNYHTAYFALTHRGRLQHGERVMVRGAAGGVGSACLQLARALGATTIAVVSSEKKEQFVREIGTDHVIRFEPGWHDAVRKLSDGGVDIVFDPVGGDDVVDVLRTLREDGRLLVIGFTAGAIPSIRANRLLLNNIDVVGVGYGAYAFPKPEIMRAVGDAVDDLARSGAIKPAVGARLPLAQAADALRLLEERQAMGKVVVDVAD